MVLVQDRPETTAEVVPENFFFQVFLGFRKPDGAVSLFFGDGTSGCGVYAALAEIFQRPPREIYNAMCDLVFEKGNGFMQEYLTIEDASQAVASASLFAHRSNCFCFRKQEGFFYIKETKKR